MRFSKAIARRPGLDFSGGITTCPGDAPLYPLMVEQHDAYVAALRLAGLEVTVLEALPGFPDAYFVEDAAVFIGDTVVLTRPGAEARRGEVGAIEPVVAGFCPVAHIEAPGTLDGGDVLLAGEHAFIGLSGRTNQSGAEQLGRLLAARGFTWQAVPVGDGLHLKSFVNAISAESLLIVEGFPAWPFGGFELVIVSAAEAYAANTLRVNDVLLTPAGYPETRERLARFGLSVQTLDVSEVRKMDGGLTCMSLRF